MYTTSPEYNNTILDIAGRRFFSKVTINFTDTLSKTYTDEDILSFSMLEENEVLTNLAIGTVIGKSFDISLFDPEQQYNPRNPNSEIAKYLKPNRVIRPFIGLELENGINRIFNNNFINGMDNWSAYNMTTTVIEEGIKVDINAPTSNPKLLYTGTNYNNFEKTSLTFGATIKKISGSSASYGLTMTMQEKTSEGTSAWYKAQLTATEFNAMAIGEIKTFQYTRSFNEILGFYMEARTGDTMSFEILDIFVIDYTEWIPLGYFYTDNFQITEQDISVKITAMSVLPLLETIPYRLSDAYIALFNSTGTTAYDLAKDVLDSSGFTNYLLMDFLREYQLPELPQFDENISSRQVLLYIAELCMCIVQDDREGKVYFEKIKRKVITQRYETSPEAYNSRAFQLDNSSNTEYFFPILGDSVLLGDWRIVGETQKLGFRSTYFCDATGLFPTEPYIILTFSDAFNVSKIIVQGDANGNDYPVDFTMLFKNYLGEVVYSKTYTGNTEMLFTTEQLSYSNIYVVELYIQKWSRPNTTAKITYFGLDEFIYSIDAEYYYRLTNKSNIETIVTKVIVKSTDGVESNYINAEIYDIEGLYPFEVLNNPLVMNQTLGAKLASDILNYFTFNKLVQEVDWVGNPALTIADNLNTVDRFLNNSTVTIVSNKIDYMGALRMTTIGMEETFGIIESQLAIIDSVGYTIIDDKGNLYSIRRSQNGLDNS